jgi:hypothetical protein
LWVKRYFYPIFILNFDHSIETHGRQHQARLFLALFETLTGTLHQTPGIDNPPSLSPSQGIPTLILRGGEFVWTASPGRQLMVNPGQCGYRSAFSARHGLGHLL